jgi:hypothetical protein
MFGTTSGDTPKCVWGFVLTPFPRAVMHSLHKPSAVPNALSTASPFQAIARMRVEEHLRFEIARRVAGAPRPGDHPARVDLGNLRARRHGGGYDQPVRKLLDPRHGGSGRGRRLNHSAEPSSEPLSIGERIANANSPQGRVSRAASILAKNAKFAKIALRSWRTLRECLRQPEPAGSSASRVIVEHEGLAEAIPTCWRAVGLTRRQKRKGLNRCYFHAA